MEDWDLRAFIFRQEDLDEDEKELCFKMLDGHGFSSAKKRRAFFALNDKDLKNAGIMQISTRKVLLLAITDEAQGPGSASTAAGGAAAGLGVGSAAGGGGGAGGAAAATGGLGPDSAEIEGLSPLYRRFLELLSLGKITEPKAAVLNAITRYCPERVMVLRDCDDAVDLYREVSLFPGPSTMGHLLTQHGLRIKGPLFPNPAEGSARLLVGATNEGVPVVVKMLAGGVSADSDQQPGGAEATACRALLESKPDAVPLVPARIITVKLGDEHMSNMGRAPGLYAALCMQWYVSLPGMKVQLPTAAVLAGGRRMATALEWMHDKEYIHMDVKADNIFVDSNGRWWLGDLGSAVRTGSPVTSTTTYYAPGAIHGLPAKPQYDWHMLAVTLVCEMNRQKNWRKLLVEDGCSPAKKLIAAVKELHGREGCEELACFLDELLKRAGYSAALP